MAVTTAFSGYIRRFDGNDIIAERRVSSSQTVTEHGGPSKIVLASSHSGVSIMPPGLSRATAVYINPNQKINVTLFGAINASFDVLLYGCLFLNGSFTDVQLKSIATGSTDVDYDISGKDL